MNVTQKFINVPEEYSEYSEYYNDEYKKILRRLVLRSNKLPLNDIDMNTKIVSILEKPMFYEEIETLITDINWYEKELEYSVEHLLYFIKCRIDKDNYQRELDERKQKSDKLYYNVLKQREKKEYDVKELVEKTFKGKIRDFADKFGSVADMLYELGNNDN